MSSQMEQEPGDSSNTAPTPDQPQVTGVATAAQAASPLPPSSPGEAGQGDPVNPDSPPPGAPSAPGELSPPPTHPDPSSRDAQQPVTVVLEELNPGQDPSPEALPAGNEEPPSTPAIQAEKVSQALQKAESQAERAQMKEDAELKSLVKEGRVLLGHATKHTTAVPAWWSKLAGAAERLAPLALATGLAIVQPELAVLLPEVAPEVLGEVAAATSTAGTWADIRLEDLASPPPPEVSNLQALASELRAAVEKPALIRAELGARTTPQSAAEMRDQRRAARAERWLNRLNKWVEKHSLGMPTAHAKAILARSDMEDRVDPTSENGLGVMHTAPSQSNPGKPTTYTMQKDGVWVKIGDHSIETTSLVPELLVDDETTSMVVPNFLQRYGRSTRDDGLRFQYVANVGYQVGSSLALASPTGGVDAPAMTWGTVLAVHEAPIDLGVPAVRHDLHVHNGEAREIGRYTQASLSFVFAGGQPSERFTSSVIQPNLRAANTEVARALTASIMQGWEFYDNSQLYGKLIFYALLRHFFTVVGANPAAVAFPAGDVVEWVNLNDANLPLTTLPNVVRSRKLVLVEETDITTAANDLQVVYWLAKSGRRMDGVANGVTPHQCYIEWGETPVAILAHRAAQQQPAAALVTAEALLTFASKLATRRSEWGSFTRGAYLAMDLMGTRLVGHGDAWWALRSSLSTHDPIIPRVADYNFMLRLINQFPPDDPAARQEGQQITGMAAVEAIRTTALYNAVVGSATTTLLYDLNITAGMMNQWITAAADTPPLFRQIMMEALNEPTVHEGNHVEPAALSIPRKAFKIWMGVDVVEQLYMLDRWAGDTGEEAAAGAHVYANMVQAVPPRSFNPIIIDNWLSQRPLEWGLCDLRPHVNFTQEVVVFGPAAQQGWIGHLGSSKYAERASGDFPPKMVVYGAQAINVITQHLRRNAQNVPVISHQDCVWTPQAVGGTGKSAAVSWNAPVAYAAADVPYQANISSFEPCCIMSFDYVTQTVRAPALVNAALGAQEQDALSYWSGQAVLNGGVALRKVGCSSGVFTLPQGLNIMRLGGVRARARGSELDNPPIIDRSGADLAGSSADVNPI